MASTEPKTKRRRKDGAAPSSDCPSPSPSPSPPLPSSPVKIHHIHYPDADAHADDSEDRGLPTTLTLASGLQGLLHTLDSDEFMTQYFRKQAVHVCCADSQKQELHAATRVSKICEAMCDMDVASILQETSSDNIFLWLRKPDGANGQSALKAKVPGGTAVNGDDASTPTNSTETIHSIEIADPGTAYALHTTAGHATYCRAPPEVEQRLVANLLRDTGLGCGQYDPSGSSPICLARGEVETFISTPGHITNWHYDFQENFTIQLSGTKRWTLQASTIKDPMRGCTPHYASPEAVESQLKAAHLHDRKFQFTYPQVGVNATGDAVTIDIRPGDVFYFPAGMWHKIETIEPGVSINVSLMAANYVAVTCQALHHLLLQDAKWRQPILNTPKPNAAVDVLANLLEELPAKIEQLRNNQRGAQAIIPPILQHAPAFAIDEDDDGGDDNAHDVGGDNASHGEKEADDNDTDEHADEIDEEESDVETPHDNDMSQAPTDTAVDDSFLDPCEFDSYPDGWKYDETKQYFRNRLAHLARCDELRGFYTPSKPADELCFVLNVIYAGNEMHQSNVRVEFCAASLDLANELIAIEVEKSNAGAVLQHDDKQGAMKKFLVYHGYFV